ncbi:unnamed protein product, partial [Amoebophrya sp. A120]
PVGEGSPLRRPPDHPNIGRSLFQVQRAAAFNYRDIGAAAGVIGAMQHPFSHSVSFLKFYLKHLSAAFCGTLVPGGCRSTLLR